MENKIIYSALKLTMEIMLRWMSNIGACFIFIRPRNMFTIPDCFHVSTFDWTWGYAFPDEIMDTGISHCDQVDCIVDFRIAHKESNSMTVNQVPTVDG